ncbi:MAG: DUF3122 domain-containing protein [Thermosynechococcaceae cyanobacterium]
MFKTLKQSQMSNWIRTGTSWFLLGSTLALLFLLGMGALTPASAAISLTKENQGQMLYQSREVLWDQQGYSWQVVVSKHASFASPPTISLQLAGPTDQVMVDHDQPLTLVTSQGNTLKAMTEPESLYINRPLAPNVVQYDLKPVVADLDRSVELAIATQDQKTIQLTVPATVIQEWQTVAACADILCVGS